MVPVSRSISVLTPPLVAWARLWTGTPDAEGESER